MCRKGGEGWRDGDMKDRRIILMLFAFLQKEDTNRLMSRF